MKETGSEECKAFGIILVLIAVLALILTQCSDVQAKGSPPGIPSACLIDHRTGQVVDKEACAPVPTPTPPANCPQQDLLDGDASLDSQACFDYWRKWLHGVTKVSNSTPFTGSVPHPITIIACDKDNSCSGEPA